MWTVLALHLWVRHELKQPAELIINLEMMDLIPMADTLTPRVLQ